MADSAWTIVGRITAGLVLYTGLGWLISRWVGHEPVLMAVGAIVGLSLSTYMVISSLHREGTAGAGRAMVRSGQGSQQDGEAS